MENVDFNEFKEYLKYLSIGIGVRPVGSKALWLTGEYVYAVFAKKLGLKTDMQKFVYESKEGEKYELSNVIGEIGDNPNAPTVIFMAHYDTVPTSKGGIDNSSGVATVMEIASTIVKNKDKNSEFGKSVSAVLKKYNLRFIALCGEEVGCVGSKAYLNWLSDSEKNKIFCAYNFDMFMSKKEDNATLVLNTLGGKVNDSYVLGTDDFPFDNAVSKAVKQGVNEYEKETGKTYALWSPRNYGHSDHQTFHENNIDSANVTIRGVKEENGKLPKGYHTKDDVYLEDKFNFDMCRFFLESVVRSLKFLL